MGDGREGCVQDVCVLAGRKERLSVSYQAGSGGGNMGRRRVIDDSGVEEDDLRYQRQIKRASDGNAKRQQSMSGDVVLANNFSSFPLCVRKKGLPRHIQNT